MKKYLLITLVCVFIIMMLAIGWGEYLRQQENVLPDTLLQMPVASIDELIPLQDTVTEQKEILSTIDFTSNQCDKTEELFDLANRSKDFTYLNEILERKPQEMMSSVCFLVLFSQIKMEKRDFARAEEFLLQAVSIEPEHVDVIQRMSDLAYYQNKIDKAKVLGEKALTIARAAGDKKREARALGNLAAIYGKLGKSVLALNMIEQSIDLHIELNASVDLMKDYYNKATLLLSQRNDIQAVQAYEAALSQAERTNNPKRELIILKQLSNLYRKLGSEEKALESLRKLQKLYQSLLERHEQNR